MSMLVGLRFTISYSYPPADPMSQEESQVPGNSESNTTEEELDELLRC